MKTAYAYLQKVSVMENFRQMLQVYTEPSTLR